MGPTSDGMNEVGKNEVGKNEVGTTGSVADIARSPTRSDYGSDCRPRPDYSDRCETMGRTAGPDPTIPTDLRLWVGLPAPTRLFRPM